MKPTMRDMFTKLNSNLGASKVSISSSKAPRHTSSEMAQVAALLSKNPVDSLVDQFHLKSLEHSYHARELATASAMEYNRQQDQQYCVGQSIHPKQWRVYQFDADEDSSAGSSDGDSVESAGNKRSSETELRDRAFQRKISDIVKVLCCRNNYTSYIIMI